MPPLLADFIYNRVCKPICEKSLTLPPLRYAGEQLLAKFFCAHRPYQNKSYGNHIFCGHPPVPNSSEDIVLWTDCNSACGNSTAPGASGEDQPSTGSSISENSPINDAPGAD